MYNALIPLLQYSTLCLTMQFTKNWILLYFINQLLIAKVKWGTRHVYVWIAKLQMQITKIYITKKKFPKFMMKNCTFETFWRNLMKYSFHFHGCKENLFLLSHTEEKRCTPSRLLLPCYPKIQAKSMLHKTLKGNEHH